MQVKEMPSIGTMLTYSEAISAYDHFEQSILEKAYGAGLPPAVKLYDLLWELESIAQKFGIEDKGVFSRLKKEICSFSSERTALANGVNGERFYLMQDESALKQHDETHLFKIRFDGDGLVRDLDEALDLLSKEAAKTEEYDDMYSSGWLERNSGRQERDPFLKWAGIGICVLMFCLGISMFVHLVLQVGFCFKWLL